MKRQVYVISAGRYDKLPFTDEQKANYIFCVKNGEGQKYRDAACAKVYESGKLIESRNFALEHAFERGLMCIQLSDDLKSVHHNKNFGQKKIVPTDYAISDIASKFSSIKGIKLLGIPPTNNDFFAKHLVSKNSFCIGDALFIKPNPLRFDGQLTLKEDYDYTLQHIQKYGTLRYQKYLFQFDHYTNSGGAVDIRNSKEEERNIRILIGKWGDKIKLNSKRKNEILI